MAKLDRLIGSLLKGPFGGPFSWLRLPAFGVAVMRPKTDGRGPQSLALASPRR